MGTVCVSVISKQMRKPISLHQLLPDWVDHCVSHTYLTATKTIKRWLFKLRLMDRTLTLIWMMITNFKPKCYFLNIFPLLTHSIDYILLNIYTEVHWKQINGVMFGCGTPSCKINGMGSWEATQICHWEIKQWRKSTSWVWF